MNRRRKLANRLIAAGNLIAILGDLVLLYPNRSPSVCLSLLGFGTIPLVIGYAIQPNARQRLSYDLRRSPPRVNPRSKIGLLQTVALVVLVFVNVFNVTADYLPSVKWMPFYGGIAGWMLMMVSFLIASRYRLKLQQS